MSTLPTIPTFEEIEKRIPRYSAWGQWAKPELGALNYLSDEVVLRATREEIRHGVRVGLNLPLDLINPPFLGRRGFERQIINKAPRVINDDVITFNTQGSSQWDSFRHFAYQKEGKFYNNVTQDDVHSHPESKVNGIQAWAPRGIAGRAVLIDYDGWTKSRNLDYDRLGGHAISFHEVEQIVKEYNIELRQGDIFLLRTGFVQAYSKLSLEQRQKAGSTHVFPGFAQSRDAAKWLWSHQFAAVAADSPAFECVPSVDEEFGMLHPILLSGWGTPIGELFDLDLLAEECQRLGRWSFFVSSSPLHYTGAVASPPNIMAIL